jgi:hypothetical protein
MNPPLPKITFAHQKELKKGINETYLTQESALPLSIKKSVQKALENTCFTS